MSRRVRPKPCGANAKIANIGEIGIKKPVRVDGHIVPLCLFQLVVDLVGDGLQPLVVGSLLHVLVIGQVLEP